MAEEFSLKDGRRVLRMGEPMEWLMGSVWWWYCNWLKDVIIMQRLKHISAGLVDPLEYLKLSSLVTAQDRAILHKVQAFCQDHLHTQQFLDCYERAEFPYYLLPHLRQLAIASYFVPAPHGQALPLLTQGLIIATIAAHDPGFSTFLFLQLPLSARTIALLGSEEQKRLIPQLMSFDKICGWGLTEREVGSNSTRISTTFEKQGDSYLLRGNKRWIGNGVNDYMIVYGKIAGSHQVVGALVDMRSHNVESSKIPNKYCFRIVQNAQVDFRGVTLPLNSLLPGADSYKTGVEDVIKHSRLMIVWNTVGTSLGAFNVALKEVKVRKQFGKQIAHFQLIQQRIVKMMAEVQVMLLAAWRLTELSQKGVDIATVGMFKAWLSSRARLVCSLGREVMGSRGMAGEALMRRLLDMEALYTYQGSYDINVLLAGSQLTGIKAFT